MHLAALKYIMAGDLESLAPLEALEERFRAIDWNDPTFIAFSDEMRSGVPKLTPEQEASLRPSLLSLIHAMNEKIARDNETATALMPQLEKMIEVQNNQSEQAGQFIKRVTAFASALLDLHSKMIAQLETLDVDTSAYKLPKL